MSQTRKISVREVICDIRAGASRAQLMEKYALTPRVLGMILKKLADASAVSRIELVEVLACESPDVFPEQMREQNRYYLDFDLPIYERDRPEVLGHVRDISMEGVGLSGLDAGVDQTRTFVVLGDTFGEISPFEFEATCRWCKIEDGGERVAGMQITNITPEDLRELLRLTQMVTLEG